MTVRKTNLTDNDFTGEDIMTTSREQKRVWVDTDISIGHKSGILHYCDVDDGYALAALLRSPEIQVVGISSTLGNTNDIKVSTSIARTFIASYGPNSVQVFQGASTGLSEHPENMATNDGVEKMAEALRHHPMTILSLGAATNIALLLLKYPELENRITEIIAVAGRRGIDQHFISGKWQPEPFRDLNFEADPRAYAILLQSSIPTTLVPYEACSSVWIKPGDLITLGQANRVGKFLARHSFGWIAEWETVFGANGFNPFDLVAAGYVIAPHLFSSQQLQATIETGPDDTSSGKTKPYLICNTTVSSGLTVNYCTGTDSTCKRFLLKKICTHDMTTFLLGLSHINVIVDSVEEATRFYSETLGFIRARDEDGNDMDYKGVEMEAFALDAGIMDGRAKVDVRFLKHPQAGIYLELMHYHTPQGNTLIPPQPKTYDAGGPRHIAMEVSNCNEVFRFLKGRDGVTMINSGKNYHPVKLDGFPITFFYWIDKYGIQWEMEEGRRMGNTSRSII